MDSSDSINNISDNYQEVKAQDSYPKQNCKYEDPCISNPFLLISGESLSYLGRITDGIIGVSNYRLLLRTNATTSVPSACIEYAEIKDIFYLFVYCKDAKTFKISFISHEQCSDVLQMLNKILSIPNSIEDVFAFAFYSWSLEESQNIHTLLVSQEYDSYYKLFNDEYQRMGFEPHLWRVSTANLNFKLCPTYPQKLIVPSSINDGILEAVAQFRSARRIPAVVWRHPNGAVIARCSQPEVGVLGWRSQEDEQFIKAIADACNKNYSQCDGMESLVIENNKLLIMDARSYTTAFANRARGGGCECPEYYPGCEIQFMNLANIHAIRKSNHMLRTLLSSSSDVLNWLSLLDNSKWLLHIMGLMRAAMTVVKAITEERRPVVVHCSDGWDRTPQITALAQVMMDPYYRTFQGFQVLVEREWLEFGHKFSDRCGVGLSCEDINERCPVFLQWLDCIHQLLHQFPTTFQFNQSFLVLIPSSHTKDLHLWKSVYLTEDQESLCAELQFPVNSTPEESEVSCDGLGSKTKSCEDLANAVSSSLSFGSLRRLSDPSLCENSPPYLAMLNSAIGETLPNEKGENVKIPNDCAVNSCKQTSVLNLSGDSGADTENVLNLSDVEDGEEATELELSASSNHQSELYCDSDSHDNIKKLPGGLMCGKMYEKSIEGSTDTLVAEVNGIIEDKDTKEVKRLPGNYCRCHSEPKCFSDRCSSFKCPTDDQDACIFLCSVQCFRKSLCALENLADKSFINNYCNQCRKQFCESSNFPVLFEGLNGGLKLIPHLSAKSAGDIPTALQNSVVNYHSSQDEKYSNDYDSSSIDGLGFIADDINKRLHQIFITHQMERDALQRQLNTAKHALHYLSKFHHHHHECGIEDQVTLPESAGSECSSVGQESGVSDTSWEAVEEGDSNPTLWVPDHAVDQCNGCDNKFWAGRRKHHCRSCGKIFCSECSCHSVPVPQEQLYHPVRVCGTCYSSLVPEHSRPKMLTTVSN